MINAIEWSIKFRSVETHNYQSFNFTGVNAELNLSHMALQAMHLGGGRALSYSGLSKYSSLQSIE